MAAVANLSGRLPEGEGNGLAAVVRQLIEEPSRVHVVLALIDTASITTKVDSGERVPTVRVRRIEVIVDPDDREHMRRLIMREYERRTGKAVLPFNLEADLEAAFGDTPTDDRPE